MLQYAMSTVQAISTSMQDVRTYTLNSTSRMHALIELSMEPDDVSGPDALLTDAKKILE